MDEIFFKIFDKYYCVYCCLSLNKKELIILHNEKRKTLCSTLNNFICEYCNINICNKYYYIQHMKNHELQNNTNYISMNKYFINYEILPNDYNNPSLIQIPFWKIKDELIWVDNQNGLYDERIAQIFINNIYFNIYYLHNYSISIGNNGKFKVCIQNKYEQVVIGRIIKDIVNIVINFINKFCNIYHNLISEKIYNNLMITKDRKDFKNYIKDVIYSSPFATFTTTYNCKYDNENSYNKFNKIFYTNIIKSEYTFEQNIWYIEKITNILETIISEIEDQDKIKPFKDILDYINTNSYNKIDEIQTMFVRSEFDYIKIKKDLLYNNIDDIKNMFI